MIKSLLFFICFIPAISMAQDIPTGIEFNESRVYKDNIHTVLLHPNGFDQADASIELNSGGQLRLAFDDFQNDIKNYRYTLVHCDHNWQQSDINSFEYLKGFEELDINDYSFSRNTSYDYIHYEALFPNQDMEITKSGNYVLLVYDSELSRESLILCWQFYVYVPKITMNVSVNQSRLSMYRNTHQEIKLLLNTSGINLINPESTVYIEVQQNGRKDNIIQGIKPRLFLDNILHYDQDDEILFQGGNEFRGTDIRSFRVNSERVSHIRFNEQSGYHIYLFPDESRSRKPYVNDEDLNGRKAIATESSFEPNTEGDYGWVHFTLPYHVPLPNSNVYLVGGLNDWNLDFKSKMYYDFNKRAYADSLFLKQGYYNFLYGVLENGKKSADISFMEGSHYQTKNEYKIFVYYRQPGTIYDQLVGYEMILAPQ